MQALSIDKVFTLIEPGPVVLVSTFDGVRANLMTISWTMVLGFSGELAITTGAWNFSYGALTTTRECVIAIPTAEMIDTVVGIGTCSGRDTDKFAKFGLTALPASRVRAPLVAECLANIEARVVDIVERHDIVVLQAVAAHIDAARKERRMLHAIGDGTFVVDGRRMDRREAMLGKLPAGV